MSDFPFSIPRRGDDSTKIENGTSSLEIASPNGACVFTPNGLTAKKTTFAADGNVGIGTTDPKTNLHVYDTVNTPSIAFQHLTAASNAGNDDFLGDLCLHRSPRADPFTPKNQVGIRSIRRANQHDDQADIEFYVRNGNEGEQIPMVINSTGTAGDTRVGMGTTSPSEQLEVGGNIKLSGGVEVGGSQGNGIALYLKGSSPKIVNDSGFLDVQSEYNIEFTTDTNGNNAGAEYKFNSRINTGVVAAQIMNLNGYSGNLQVQGTVTPNHSFSDDRLKTDEAYLENATESIGKLSVQTYNKEQTLNFNLLERTGETVREVGVIAQEVYYNAPEFRNLIETGYNKTYDASYTTYEDVSHTTWDGDVSNTTFERVSRVVPRKLKTSTKVIPSEMDLSGVPIGEDPDYEAAGWSKEQPASVNYQGFIPYLIKSIQELTERLAALENK